MTGGPIDQDVMKVAVVGHTNTGKTSLLRTLSRDRDFGDVSNRPATTKGVDQALLYVDGEALVALFDTPGLEDPMALLERLAQSNPNRSKDWHETINDFLASPAAKGEFAQEALALTQVLKSDLAVYVIDARERVLAKYRDELEILSRCAVPILPLLNFIASPDAKTEAWREQLARLNLHAVAAYDTVVLDARNEQQLFEKMQVLLHRFEQPLNRLLRSLEQRRQEIARAAALMIADLLIDGASYVVIADDSNETHVAAAKETLEAGLRSREQKCLQGLLDLYRFRADDLIATPLPVADGQWGVDLFTPEALKQFGIQTGGGAAVGAMSGLAVDVMVGGLTLGAAAATGAAVGALVGAVGDRGRQVVHLLRGKSELRAEDETLLLLATRQVALTQALARRGHAAQQPLSDDQAAAQGGRKAKPALDPAALKKHLRLAAAHPEWSELNKGARGLSDSGRHDLRDALAALIGTAFGDGA